MVNETKKSVNYIEQNPMGCLLLDVETENESWNFVFLISDAVLYHTDVIMSHIYTEFFFDLVTEFQTGLFIIPLMLVCAHLIP